MRTAETRGLRRGRLPADLRHRWAFFHIWRRFPHVFHWNKKERGHLRVATWSRVSELLWTVCTFSSCKLLWWKNTVSVVCTYLKRSTALRVNFPSDVCALGLSQSEMKAGNPYANHFTPTAVLSEEINSPHICILSYCISRRLLLVLWQGNELEAEASAHERADKMQYGDYNCHASQVNVTLRANYSNSIWQLNLYRKLLTMWAQSYFKILEAFHNYP